MFKKFLCLMAILVLVSGCESMGEDGMGGKGGKGPSVPGTQSDLEQNVGDRVFFDFNTSDLSTEARTTLEHQVAWLKKYDKIKVTVEGNCDERGTREYNIALGQRRATAAKNFLVAGGIKASRIKTLSYGKERPAVLGHDEEAWAQNRRSVTVVVD